MSKNCFLVICLACITTCSLFYVNAGVNGFRDPSTPIDLQGKLAGMGEMRTQEQQVEAFHYATYVQLNYLIDLGILDISVMDVEGDPVFHEKVNATSGGDLPIDINNWEPGTYTLVITDGHGGRLEGSFVII